MPKSDGGAAGYTNSTGTVEMAEVPVQQLDIPVSLRIGGEWDIGRGRYGEGAMEVQSYIMGAAKCRDFQCLFY